MVHNTCEKNRDFEIKSLKDTHPTIAEFHYLVICIQERLMFCSLVCWGFLFCFSLYFVANEEWSGRGLLDKV